MTDRGDYLSEPPVCDACGEHHYWYGECPAETYTSDLDSDYEPLHLDGLMGQNNDSFSSPVASSGTTSRTSDE